MMDLFSSSVQDSPDRALKTSLLYCLWQDDDVSERDWHWTMSPAAEVTSPPDATPLGLYSSTTLTSKQGSSSILSSSELTEVAASMSMPGRFVRKKEEILCWSSARRFGGRPAIADTKHSTHKWSLEGITALKQNHSLVTWLKQKAFDSDFLYRSCHAAARTTTTLCLY